MTEPFPNPLPNPLTADTPAEQSTAVNDLAAVDHVLSDCRQVLADVDATIQRAINDCLNVCHADVRFCHACIMGAIQKEQSIAATALDKCWDKINRQLVEHVGEAFAAAQALGIPLPSSEQLAAALAGQPIAETVPANSDFVFVPAGEVPPPPDCPEGSQPRWNGNQWYCEAIPPKPQPCPDGFHRDPTTNECVPDVIIPPPPPADPCHPGGPAERIICTRSVSSVSLKPLYWYTVNLIQGDEFEVCIYRGFSPPVQYIGKLNGPFCAEPDPSLVIADYCQQQCKDIPPPPPPPPPNDGPPHGGDGVVTPPAANLPTFDIGGDLCDPKKIVDAGLRILTESKNPSRDADNFLTLASTVVGASVGKFVSNFIGLPLVSDIAGIVSAVTGSILGFASHGDFIRAAIAPRSTDPDCGTSQAIAHSFQAAFSRVFGGWFGSVPPATQRSWEYILNFHCPNTLPNQTDVDRLLLTGFIQGDQWLNTTRFLGNCPDWEKLVVETNKTRIGIQDAYRLYQLEDIDEDEFVQAWKRKGIDIDKERHTWEAAIQQYPGMSDLIRMMTRDVADPNVVQLLGLDADFDKKWAGQLKQWGKSQGVSDDIAKMFWRAHWQQPSPGTVFEWFHRLRPDDRDPEDPNANITVDRETVRELLQIADYVPGLVDNYLATSYRPFGRRDIIRLYRLGAIRDVDGIRRAFRDIGLSDLDAGRMAEATVRSEGPAKAKLKGELAEAEILRGYRNDTITEAEARRLLIRLGYETEDVDTRIGTANLQRQSQSREVQLKSLRTRYFYGEFTDGEAEAEVGNIIPAPDQAARIVQLWSAERKAKRKYPTVQTLCTWFDKGLINLDEYFRRVRNLNYDEADAFRVVEACQIGIRERQFKELEREKAKQDKAAQKRAKEMAAALREQKKLARQQMLMHKHTRKTVVKDSNGQFTTTITDTFTDRPTETETNISERINQTKPPKPPKP